MLQINKTEQNGNVIFELSGRLDTTTSPELENAIQESLDSANEITLDFSQLTYISSAGLRLLLVAQKAMSKRGTMTLLHVGETVREIFELTGFSDILTIK